MKVAETSGDGRRGRSEVREGSAFWSVVKDLHCVLHVKPGRGFASDCFKVGISV